MILRAVIVFCSVHKYICCKFVLAFKIHSFSKFHYSTSLILLFLSPDRQNREQNHRDNRFAIRTGIYKEY